VSLSFEIAMLSPRSQRVLRSAVFFVFTAVAWIGAAIASFSERISAFSSLIAES
jgi:hypothetical protein